MGRWGTGGGKNGGVKAMKGGEVWALMDDGKKAGPDEFMGDESSGQWVGNAGHVCRF